MKNQRRPRRLSTKVVLTLALVVSAAAVVGVGAFATFTDSQSVSQTTSSGTVTLDPVNVNGANNRLSVGASNIAAGDTIDRAVLVKNSGTIALASTSGIVLSTAATTSSTLDTDTTNGLKISVDRCSVAWTEAGPPYTYTCGGTTTNIVNAQPVVGSWDLSASLNLSAGASNYLKVRLALPAAAPNSMQNKTSTIQYTFTATQRAGTAQ